jgi:hypothetical protein
VAEDDINVVFAAEDEGLTAYIERLRTQFGQLDATAVAEGQKISAAFQKMGISAQTAFGMMGKGQDQAKNQLAQYMASLEQAAAATSKVTGATNEATDAEEKFSRSGINVGNMLERIAVRLVVFEAMRLAIKGVTDAFKEIASFEITRVHFENLTTGAQDATAAESALLDTVKKTNQEFGKLSEVTIMMENAGDSIMAATADTDLLAKRATATGQDVVQLAKAFEAVKLDEATVPQMFALANAAGTAKEELIDEVTAYAQLTREIKEVDHAHAEQLRAMQEVTHEAEKQIDAQIRVGEAAEKAADKAAQAAEQAADRAARAQERLIETQESFTERILKAQEAQGKPGAEPPHMDPTLATFLKGGGAGLPTGAYKQAITDLRTGLAQIGQEEGLNHQQLMAYQQSGIIGFRDMIEAAKRHGEAVREAAKEAADAKRQADKDFAEAARERLEAQKRQEVDDLQKARDIEALRRRQELRGLDQDRLEIEHKIASAIGDERNIADALKNSMGTVNEQFASIATSLKIMVDESPQLIEALQKIAGFTEKIVGNIKGIGIEAPGGAGHEPGFTIPDWLGNLIGLKGLRESGDLWSKLLGGGSAPGGKAEVTETHSEKIANHMENMDRNISQLLTT